MAITNQPNPTPPGTKQETWIAQSTLTPTQETYSQFQDAYSLFNRELFGANLPDCVITLQRHPRALGYYSPKRFINCSGDRSDEIALNPTHFAARTDVGVLSTLAHEMAHLWKQHFGTKGRRGYHCREWGKRMIEMGLHPSHTGQPGGRMVGYAMTHYLISGGPFEILTNQMISSGFRLSWLEADAPAGPRPPVSSPAAPEDDDASNRWKFTCPRCSLNAWAKPNAKIGCGECQILMPRNTDRRRKG